MRTVADILALPADQRAMVRAPFTSRQLAGVQDGFYRAYSFNAEGTLAPVRYLNPGLEDASAVERVRGGVGYLDGLASPQIGSSGADRLDDLGLVMAGKAGADVFAPRLSWAVLTDYSANDGDVIDLGDGLQGFSADRIDLFLRKEVGENGQVMLRVSKTGSGDFASPDRTVILDRAPTTAAERALVVRIGGQDFRL